MSERDLSDEERERYEQQWEDLDEKVLLAQMLTELQQIRRSLQGDRGGREGSSEMYECVRCGARVEADERERHASGEHRAPPGVVEELFEEV